MKSEEFYLSDGGMTDERKNLLCYRTQGFNARDTEEHSVNVWERMYRHLSDSDSKGRWFESSRAYQKLPQTIRMRQFLYAKSQETWNLI